MKRLSDKNGFTLLEVIVAVAIIAMVAAPILDGIFGALKLEKTNQDKVNASLLVNKIIQEIERGTQYVSGMEEYFPVSDLTVTDNNSNPTDLKVVSGPVDYSDYNNIPYDGLSYKVLCTAGDKEDYDVNGFSVFGYMNYLKLEINEPSANSVFVDIFKTENLIKYNPPDKFQLDSDLMQNGFNKFSIIVNGNNLSVGKVSYVTSVTSPVTSLYGDDLLNSLYKDSANYDTIQPYGTESIKNILIVNNTSRTFYVYLYNPYYNSNSYPGVLTTPAVSAPTPPVNVIYNSSNVKVHEKLDAETWIIRDIKGVASLYVKQDKNKSTYTVQVYKYVNGEYLKLAEGVATKRTASGPGWGFGE